MHRQGESALESGPRVAHAWEAGDVLAFPAQSHDGFEVRIVPAGRELIVFTQGYHEHLSGKPSTIVEQALGLVRDLLSPDMRIRERRAGGSPYRWVLERRAATGWEREASTGLLFWNWFGRRSERIYQNHQLPGRLVAAV